MINFRPATQTDSLLYRRMVFCGSAADCQSATSPERFRGTQINNLRYDCGTFADF